jgi:hypothetical protein
MRKICIRSTSPLFFLSYARKQNAARSTIVARSMEFSADKNAPMSSCNAGSATVSLCAPFLRLCSARTATFFFDTPSTW